MHRCRLNYPTLREEIKIIKLDLAEGLNSMTEAISHNYNFDT